MHPTLILGLWFFAVILLQRVPTVWLVLAVLAGVVAGGATVRRHWLNLLKRSRWLLLVLALTFLLMTPGERLLAGWPATQEGAHLALEHVMRLLAILFAVAWLVGGRSQETLLSAFWGAAAFLRSARMKRAVIRLALTLNIAVVPPGGTARGKGWRVLLDDLQAGDEADGIERLAIDARPLPVAQAVLIAGAGLLTAWSWWRLA